MIAPQAIIAKPGSDAPTWNHLLIPHTYVEGRLATVLQRRHGLGQSEYRALSFPELSRSPHHL